MPKQEKIVINELEDKELFPLEDLSALCKEVEERERLLHEAIRKKELFSSEPLNKMRQILRSQLNLIQKRLDIQSVKTDTDKLYDELGKKIRNLVRIPIIEIEERRGESKKTDTSFPDNEQAKERDKKISNHIKKIQKNGYEITTRDSRRTSENN